MTAFLLQAWIVITGGAAVWLTTNPGGRYHRLACCIGLAGQPCWYITTLQNFQWGVFLLSVIYTASYVRGILLHRRFLTSKGENQ